MGQPQEKAGNLTRVGAQKLQGRVLRNWTWSINAPKGPLLYLGFKIEYHTVASDMEGLKGRVCRTSGAVIELFFSPTWALAQLILSATWDEEI